MKGDVGPYLNEEGDIWVPRTVPYLEARRLARSGMEYSADRLAYVGKENAYLTGFARDCDCDEGCAGGTWDEDDAQGEDWGAPLAECNVPAWHFRSVER